jgi:protein involved in polysaccharide export with SLBB domain
VIYTGKYALETKTQRISDLINRSGGLTQDAYLSGAVLVRTRTLTRTEEINNVQGVQNLIKQNLQAGVPAAVLQNQVLATVNQRSQFVGIDLEQILDNPGSKYDLLLMEGDTLRIPKRLQTVRINGEVLFPAMIRYDKSLGFRDYINRAGGFSERSLRKNAYVVHANGSVRGTKSFLFFKNYPSVLPGDEIYIPVKRERERMRTGEWITIGATLISMMAIVITLLR